MSSVLVNPVTRHLEDFFQWLEGVPEHLGCLVAEGQALPVHSVGSGFCRSADYPIKLPRIQSALQERVIDTMYLAWSLCLVTTWR